MQLVLQYTFLHTFQSRQKFRINRKENQENGGGVRVVEGGGYQFRKNVKEG